MIKIYTVLFFILLSITTSWGQNQNIIPEIIELVKKPKIIKDLEVDLSNCKYIDTDTYIVNSDYVIYENCNVRKYLYPDVSSFHFPKHNERGFFALDKNGIYFRGNFIKIDTTGFEIVGINNDYNKPEILWKTKKSVYKNNIIIDVSDVQSFEPIECFNSYYFKDKNYIYYFDKKIEGSDGSSVVESCNNYCYDKNNFYLTGEIVKFENEKVTPINDVIFKTSEYVLTKELKKLNMDAITIKRLSSKYSIDKDYVYYKTDKLPIKSKNFKNVEVWDQVNSAYVTDDINVYSREGILEPVFDAKTFGMLPHSDFCYDKNGIYKREWIEKLNKVVNQKFPFKYKSAVTSKNTFITDDYRYIIYENQAYDLWSKIVYENLTKTQVNLAKINKLSITKTDNKMKPVEKEFEYLLIKKEGKIYWNNNETIANADSFESIGLLYKDKKRVFRYSKERGLITIKGIDANSTMLFNGFLADDNYIYYWNTQLIKNEEVELLGVFAGYRLGCGLDETPASDYYLFKNIDGYWLVLITDEVFIRNLGTYLTDNWNKNIKDFKIK